MFYMTLSVLGECLEPECKVILGDILEWDNFTPLPIVKNIAASSSCVFFRIFRGVRTIIQRRGTMVLKFNVYNIKLLLNSIWL